MPTIFHDFLDLIFPPLCLACNQVLVKGEDAVCTSCRMVMPKTCLHEYKGEALERKFYGKLPIKYALAYLKFQKKGRVQRLIHQLKYKDRPEVGEMLGRWYGTELAEAGYIQAFDLIIPVPLHPKKLKKRGYNQSEGFAAILAEKLQSECRTDLLIRTQNNSTQTRLARYDRWDNVANLFEVTKAEVVQGKHVLLVDDVITTGSTLEACGQALVKAGAQHISIITMAMAG